MENKKERISKKENEWEMKWIIKNESIMSGIN